MSKNAAFGASLSIEIATVPTIIAQVKDIQGPTIETDTVDVTSHDSPGQWEEHVGTIKRSGTITLECELDPGLGDQVGFFGLLGVITPTILTYNLPVALTQAFSAIPTGWVPSQAHDGSITGSLTLKPTGVLAIPA